MICRSHTLARRWAPFALGLGLVPAVHAAPPPASNDANCIEMKFLQENSAVMDKMMAAMDTPPAGDVDRDFVAMMVPHHQGAIDMAQLVLRYGRNEQIRRIAQEIIVTQQQEIVAMRMAVGLDRNAGTATSNAARTDGNPHPHHSSGPSVASSETCP